MQRPRSGFERALEFRADEPQRLAGLARALGTGRQQKPSQRGERARPGFRRRRSDAIRALAALLAVRSPTARRASSTSSAPAKSPPSEEWIERCSRCC
jgi:hypothetical protein